MRVTDYLNNTQALTHTKLLYVCKIKVTLYPGTLSCYNNLHRTHELCFLSGSKISSWSLHYTTYHFTSYHTTHHRITYIISHMTSYGTSQIKTHTRTQHEIWRNHMAPCAYYQTTFIRCYPLPRLPTHTHTLLLVEKSTKFLGLLWNSHLSR